MLACALCSLPGLSLVTRALQSGEIFSPASGHAQVIAQGVAPMPDEAVWQAVFDATGRQTNAEFGQYTAARPSRRIVFTLRALF